MRFASICSVVALLVLTLGAFAEAVDIAGLPVKLGDTVEDVQKALNTSLEPEKMENTTALAIRTGKKEELRLKTKGIWVFFAKGKVYTFRVDRPFAGNVGGVKIGDSSSKIEKIFGPPIKRSTFGKSTTYTYYFDDITTTRFDVNQDDEIETIFFTK